MHVLTQGGQKKGETEFPYKTVLLYEYEQEHLIYKIQNSKNICYKMTL